MRTHRARKDRYGNQTAESNYPNWNSARLCRQYPHPLENGTDSFNNRGNFIPQTCISRTYQNKNKIFLFSTPMNGYAARGKKTDYKSQKHDYEHAYLQYSFLFLNVIFLGVEREA